MPLFFNTVFAQQGPEPFHKNERVVFAGNSITEAGLYESYIWLYYMTHFPDRKLTIFNAGIGGDVAEQIYSRLEGDILAKKPTVLAVTFGMNDSKYFEYNSPNPKVEDFVDASLKSYRKIETRLRELKSVKKILMSSSPYDETVEISGNQPFKGKSKTIEKIIEFQKRSAVDNNWSYVDFYYPMKAINQKEQKKNPGYTNTGPDRIHPGSAGHFIMAYLFLKSQGLNGMPVADVRVDYTSGKLLRAENAKISHIQRSERGIAFDYLAKSLPYPIDTVPRAWQNPQLQSDALVVVPFQKEFNSEQVTVKGMPAGNYSLRIDGKDICVVTASDLDTGVNMALLKNTPQYRQSLEVMKLNNERKDLEGKYRNYYWVNYNFLKAKGMLFDHSDAARDTIAVYAPENGWLSAKKDDFEQIRNKESRVQLNNRIQNLVSEIYQINRPQKHRIEIFPK